MLLVSLFVLFALMMITRYILNRDRYSRTDTLHKHYLNYLNSEDLGIAAHVEEIKDLFERAGLPDIRLPFNEPAGFGMLRQGFFSIYENISVKRGDIAGHLTQHFVSAKSVFSKRCRESYRPVYWLEVLSNLPKYFFQMVGLSANEKLMKVAQLIYWALGAWVILENFNVIDFIKIQPPQ